MSIRLLSVTVSVTNDDLRHPELIQEKPACEASLVSNLRPAAACRRASGACGPGLVKEP